MKVTQDTVIINEADDLSGKKRASKTVRSKAPPEADKCGNVLKRFGKPPGIGKNVG
jgi:hypothetical protein